MALSTDELYGRALDLAKTVDDSFIDLGRYLEQLQRRDPERFQQVWQKSNLGRRKAYYLIDIAARFGDLPVPRTRLKKVGWTKLGLLAKKVTKANVDELLSLAEVCTAKQLEQRLRGEEPHEDNARCVLMYFSPKEYEELEEKLLKHGAMRSGKGIIKKEEALLAALRGKNTTKQ